MNPFEHLGAGMQCFRRVGGGGLLLLACWSLNASAQQPASAPAASQQSAPPEPLRLTGGGTTNAAVPVVEVFGAAPDAQVEVVTEDGRPLGRRFGPGPVQLVLLQAEGTYRVYARVRTNTSNTVELTVDRTVAVPQIGIGTTVDSPRLFYGAIEPGARMEAWWGFERFPVAPFDGAVADADGVAAMPLPEDFQKGWVVQGFARRDDAQPALIESWPEIDRDFGIEAPAPDLPADGFAYRIHGWMRVEAPGVHKFELTSDDGARLWVDSGLLISTWDRAGTKTEEVTLTAGLHLVRVEYYDQAGPAALRLRCAWPGGSLTSAIPVLRVILPPEQLQLFGVQVDAAGNRSKFSPWLLIPRR